MTHLQVPLCSECLLTDGATEGLISCMSSHVDLKGGTGAKVLATARAQMLRVFHSRNVVLQSRLLLLVGLFAGLFLGLFHLLGTLQFALQWQQAQFGCVRVGHLLGLVQNGVECATLKWTRRRGQVRELAQEALDRA